jgi:CheY-like chemotaxis protein
MEHPPTVLIVDDDAGIRKMLVEMLSLEGYGTETANNGREALDLLAHSGPRIVLLDLLMPEIDGRGVVERLSAIPAERRKHKIILVSATHVLATAEDVQAEGRLAKPFTLDDLLDALRPVTTPK